MKAPDSENRSAASAAPVSADLQRTDWLRIALLIGVGVGCAVQIGKVPPAIGALRETLGVTIVQAAWVLSLLSVIASICGCIAGTLAGALGAGRVTVASTLVVGAASAAGALAPNVGVLFASRAVEGIGLLMAVVAVPALLAANTAPHDRQVVSGLWGSYMGIGMAVAMLAAPALLDAAGWRALWLASALVMLGLAVALIVLRPRSPPPARHELRLDTFRRAIGRREPLLMALIFFCHAYQYFAVFGFLPTVLAEAGFDARAASMWTAFAAAMNAAGNATCGWLMKRGARAWALFAGASLVLCAAEIAIYAPQLGSGARIAAAVVFAYVGGLVPAAIFVRLRMTMRDAASGTIVMGLIVQCSQIGQLVAPVGLAALASVVGGWHASPLLLVPAAAAVIASGFALRRYERVGAAA